jgi:thiol-disulfide isomerase/thioredoxin
LPNLVTSLLAYIINFSAFLCVKLRIMKRLQLALFFLAISTLIFSQPAGENRCPSANTAVQGSRNITIANDFTITTTDGITRNLYNTLDSGKTVFIDLFYTTCSWCQTYAPVIEEIYQNSGAGESNIVFWGISNNLNDPDDVIDQYRSNFNVSNPCAGPDGGGTTAHTIVIAGQEFLGWPTYCVVCPDRTMYFDPCYPPTVTGFDPFFESCGAFTGVEEDRPGEPISGIGSIYPNPTTDRLNIEVMSITANPVTLELYNLLGMKVSSYFFETTSGNQTLIIPVDLLPSGTYFLKLIQENQLVDSHKILIF